MKTIKRYSGICSMWLAAVTSLATLSCADDWDNHYQGTPQPEKTIWETIESRPDLKDFADLLRKKGYDKYLNTTQRYTVWAPKGKIDTTLVTGQLMNEEEVLTQVVQNHIARSLISASSIVNDTIRVLNGKRMPFVADESGSPYFNNVQVVESNLMCSNGVLHIMDSQAGYNNNVWSYLRQDGEFSGVSDYLYSFNKMVFDPDASTVGGVVNGEKVYTDSVFVLTNEKWNTLGYLNNEYSDYVMLVPTNDAWEEAVGRFKTFFRYPDGVDPSTSETYAKEAAVSNLVFDMKHQDKMGQNIWTSTYGFEFEDPEGEGGIFSAVTDRIPCSNGTIYKTPVYPFDPYETYVETIVLEAENENLQVSKKYCSEDDRPVFVSVANSGVSKSQYMKFTPSMTLRQSVVFALPGALSCKYDIGVVFVPLNLTRSGWVSNIDPKPTRVSFELDDGYTKPKLSVDDVEIPGTKIDTVWVTKGYEFPYCDYYPSRKEATDTKNKLEITCEVRNNETSTYTRDMYIDCIVLKPTKEGGDNE